VQTHKFDMNWKNTVITLIFETGDNSRDSLYAIKSLKKKMKIFSVIESETLVIFSVYTKKSLEL
jgi:hypothetical protein